jgi:chromosome partitioning protein
VNLAAGVALLGKRVLLVDMDPQGNATSGLGVDPRSLETTVYNCLIKYVKFHEVVKATEVSGLSLLPANADLSGAEVELVNIEEREKLLQHFLRDVNPLFDIIFIDCPPTLGILTINALVAAQGILVPVQCEYYAMEGLSRLVGNIDRVRQSFNPALKLEGIILTMFDARNTLARQVVAQVREHFKEVVYSTMIPRNVTLAEAPSYGRPAMLYNVASAGSQAYLSLAKEFVSHGEESAR